MKFLSRFRPPAKPSATPDTVLDRIVSQSRLPAWYARDGVDDTTEGRFELLLLHLFIVLHGLRGLKGMEGFNQQLFDAAFMHLDWNLRELGVGDMVVGKRVRTMAEVFYGRVKQYREGLEAGEGELAAVLAKTLPGVKHPQRIAGYVAASVTAVEQAGANVLETAEVPFGAV